jgi:hypothetical protein
VIDTHRIIIKTVRTITTDLRITAVMLETPKDTGQSMRLATTSKVHNAARGVVDHSRARLVAVPREQVSTGEWATFSAPDELGCVEITNIPHNEPQAISEGYQW